MKYYLLFNLLAHSVWGYIAMCIYTWLLSPSLCYTQLTLCYMSSLIVSFTNTACLNLISLEGVDGLNTYSFIANSGGAVFEEARSGLSDFRLDRELPNECWHISRLTYLSPPILIVTSDNVERWSCVRSWRLELGSAVYGLLKVEPSYD